MRWLIWKHVSMTIVLGVALTLLTQMASAGQAPAGYRVNLTLSNTPGDTDGLLLSLSTKKMFRTGGYSLEAEKRVEGNTLLITLKPVKAPARNRPVTMAITPASTTVSIPNKNGTYDLVISDDTGTATLTLSITDDAITLKSDGKTELFDIVDLKYNLPPKNVFGLTVVYRKGKGGKDLTDTIRKEISSLPGVTGWTPETGRYLAKAGVVNSKYVSYYRMEETIDWDAVSRIVNTYKEVPAMYVSVAVPCDGRTLKNQ